MRSKASTKNNACIKTSAQGQAWSSTPLVSYPGEASLMTAFAYPPLLKHDSHLSREEATQGS